MLKQCVAVKFRGDDHVDGEQQARNDAETIGHSKKSYGEALLDLSHQL